MLFRRVAALAARVLKLETKVSASGALTLLTDNSTGTASNTIASISDTATKNAVASLSAKVNALINAQKGS